MHDTDIAAGSAGSAAHNIPHDPEILAARAAQAVKYRA